MSKRKAENESTTTHIKTSRQRLEEYEEGLDQALDSVVLGDWALSKQQSDVQIVYESHAKEMLYFGHWAILVQKSTVFESRYKSGREVG